MIYHYIIQRHCLNKLVLQTEAAILLAENRAVDAMRAAKKSYELVMQFTNIGHAYAIETILADIIQAVENKADPPPLKL